LAAFENKRLVLPIRFARIFENLKILRTLSVHLNHSLLIFEKSLSHSHYIYDIFTIPSLRNIIDTPCLFYQIEPNFVEKKNVRHCLNTVIGDK